MSAIRMHYYQIPWMKPLLYWSHAVIHARDHRSHALVKSRQKATDNRARVPIAALCHLGGVMQVRLPAESRRFVLTNAVV